MVRTDHQSLIWLLSLRESKRKISRWIEILSHYDFAIEYRPGSKQDHCEALSRCENPGDCECPNQDTSDPLKCGPCKKCFKRAQEMYYRQLNEAEMPEESTDTGTLGKDSLVAVSVVRGSSEVDESVPGPSKQDGAI